MQQYETFPNTTEEAAVAQWKYTGLQVNRPSDQSCTWSMIHTKINISPGSSQSGIVLQRILV